MSAGWLRRRLTLIAAVFFVAAGLMANRFEVGPTGDANRLGHQFRFMSFALPDPPGMTAKSIRQVNPSLERIAAWISSVGAGVAVGDMDGDDGVSNDLCHVDPRFDKVIISPAPTTGNRFALFTLDPPDNLFNAQTMAPMGCALGDLNADGLLDIVVYYWGRTPLVFLNTGIGPMDPARFVVSDPVPTGERWYTNALTLADVDGDGRLDMVVGNYFPDGARILDPTAATRESMQNSMSDATNGGRARILRQIASTPAPRPSLQFEDDVLPDNIGRGWTLAVGAADLEDDLLPDLYFANDFGPDRLLQNRSTPGHVRLDLVEGKKSFFTPASKVLGEDSFKGMGVDFADVTGNGRLDIMVSNITTDFGLHESNFLFVRDGPNLSDFVDRSRPMGVSQAGWSWDVKFGDFDNSGYPQIVQAEGFIKGSTNRWPELHELASGNDTLLSDPRDWPTFGPGTDLAGDQPNRFFVRNGSRYVEAAAAAGLASRSVARGLATADLTGDGNLDLIVANQWAPSVAYINQCPSCGRSLDLNLYHSPAASGPGATLGVPAVGAEATVTLPDGRRLVSQVDGGNGFGKRSTELHFGLGSIGAATPLAVSLAWRSLDGTTHRQEIRLTAGRHNLLLEPTGEVLVR